jgi:hypothetical protein
LSYAQTTNLQNQNRYKTDYLFPIFNGTNVTLPMPILSVDVLNRTGNLTDGQVVIRFPGAAR